MSTEPNGAQASQTESQNDRERQLFEDVIVRDGGDVTIRFSQLGQDLDHTVEVAGVLTERAVGSLGAKASAFLSQLGTVFKDAHQEVKARRAADNTSPPSGDQPPTS